MTNEIARRGFFSRIFGGIAALVAGHFLPVKVLASAAVAAPVAKPLTDSLGGFLVPDELVPTLENMKPGVLYRGKPVLLSFESLEAAAPATRSPVWDQMKKNFNSLFPWEDPQPERTTAVPKVIFKSKAGEVGRHGANEDFYSLGAGHQLAYDMAAEIEKLRNDLEADEAALDDEEAAHSETLDMLSKAKAENEQLRSIVDPILSSKYSVELIPPQYEVSPWKVVTRNKIGPTVRVQVGVYWHDDKSLAGALAKMAEGEQGK